MNLIFKMVKRHINLLAFCNVNYIRHIVIYFFGKSSNNRKGDWIGDSSKSLFIVIIYNPHNFRVQMVLHKRTREPPPPLQPKPVSLFFLSLLLFCFGVMHSAKLLRDINTKCQLSNNERKRNPFCS